MSEGGASDDAGQQVPTLDLQQNIKDLCQTLDGLIFVVDATVPLKECKHPFIHVNHLFSASLIKKTTQKCSQLQHESSLKMRKNVGDKVQGKGRGSEGKPFQVQWPTTRYRRTYCDMMNGPVIF